MSAYRGQAEIDTLIIHCAATPNGRPFTAQDIDRWHGERGFRRHPDARIGAGRWHGKGPHARALGHIGYHYVIRVNGAVEVGRRLSETGAHAKGWNRRAIGLCLIGTDAFTIAQWEALAAHVEATRRERAKAALAALRVIGHREVAPHKRCPGFDVQAWLAADMAPPPDHILTPGDEA